MRARRLRALLAALAIVKVAMSGCARTAQDPAAVYSAQCARCHGADGRGDRRSVGLYPGLDLTASPLLRAGKRGRGIVFRRISEGYGAMPGFGERLETADVEGLIDYILRLPQGKAGR
ncbi:MAG TPA: cytochrome c [Thermoanaerobaculia bacterium]|nr:cytochrome c [Thermoanaerobaculia bacterium]